MDAFLLARCATVPLRAGWIHYLVLDLVIGSWEAEHSERAGVPHALLLPCLLATPMVGMMGAGRPIADKAMSGPGQVRVPFVERPPPFVARS